MSRLKTLGTIKVKRSKVHTEGLQILVDSDVARGLCTHSLVPLYFIVYFTYANRMIYYFNRNSLASEA